MCLLLNEFGVLSKYIFNVWVIEINYREICLWCYYENFFKSMKSWVFDLYRDICCVNWKDLDMWVFLCKFVFDWLKKRLVGVYWRY